MLKIVRENGIYAAVAVFILLGLLGGWKAWVTTGCACKCCGCACEPAEVRGK